MSFNKKAEKHLSKYKTNKMGIDQRGTFRGREYSHILPKELARFNILDAYRDRFFNDPIAEEIKFHQFFHHLNSSQAVCINYFYPFVAEGKLEWIAEIFGCQDRVSEWYFEKVVDKEEQTNFDFYMKLAGGKQLFFEIKYSEQEFGTAINDQSHQQKYDLIYSSRLQGKVKNCSMENFFRHYQILRNISYLEIDSEDELFFLYPQGNVRLAQQLEKTLLDYVELAIRERVSVYTWEDILNRTVLLLEKQTGCDNLKRAMQQLREKYLGIA